MAEKKLKVYCETSVSISVVAKAGYKCPIIITPMDFLERREEFGL